MNPLFLLPTVALAAAPTARVAWTDGAAPKAVAVLVERGGEVAGAGCTDAGTSPDAAPDGIWTCGPLPPVEGAVRVGVARDGRLVDVGEATLTAAGFAVRIDKGTAVLGDAAVLPAPRPGPPAAAVPTLLARVRGPADAAAPVLRLEGPDGSAQLTCRDDGVFPDAARNDGEHGCAGPWAGPRAEVFVNGGPSGSFGVVTWEPGRPFVFLVVDTAARMARAEAFDLPGFAPEVLEMLAPVAPDPVAPPTPTPPAPSDGGAPQPPPAEAPDHSPVASREVGIGTGASPLALLFAVVLGVGGGWAWRRRAERLPATLLPVPAPALLPGGPGLSDPACALRTDTPEALAAALLPTIARHRRVVVVAAPDVPLPDVSDGPIYRAASGDCEEIEAAVRALARTPGPAVAVLVVGDALTDAGAVAPAPVRKLREGLPVGVWMGVVAARVPEGLPAWEVEGPPWRAVRGG